MTLKSTVETLTHTAVTTAVTAVRDPRGTAVKATGLVKETAGVGIGLVISRLGGAAHEAPAPVKEVAEEVVDKVEETKAKVEKAVPDEVVEKVEETKAKVEKAVPDEVVEKVEETKAKVEKAVPAKKPAAKKAPAAKKPAAEKPAAEKPAASEDPRDHIPGPDLAAFAPPAPEDLPEPIVIEAE